MTSTYQTWAVAALPSQGRVGRGVGTQDSPEGRKLVNLTKILTEGGLPPKAAKSLANDWREI